MAKGGDVVANQCACGCGTMTVVTAAREACECGCACCSNGGTTKEEELQQLMTLRESIDRRLAELQG